MKTAQFLPPLHSLGLCQGWQVWECSGLEGKPLTPGPTEASSLNEQPWHQAKKKREFETSGLSLAVSLVAQRSGFQTQLLQTRFLGFGIPCKAKTPITCGFEYKTWGASCTSSIHIQTVAGSSLPAHPCGIPALCSELLFSSRANTSNVSGWCGVEHHAENLCSWSLWLRAMLSINSRFSLKIGIFSGTGLLATVLPESIEKCRSVRTQAVAQQQIATKESFCDEIVTMSSHFKERYSHTIVAENQGLLFWLQALVPSSFSEGTEVFDTLQRAPNHSLLVFRQTPPAQQVYFQTSAQKLLGQKAAFWSAEHIADAQIHLFQPFKRG